MDIHIALDLEAKKAKVAEGGMSMTVLINIPKEFEQHFKEDAFEDSLRRLNADAICCDRMSGNYEAELCEMLITAFAEAKEVPTPHGRLDDEGMLYISEEEYNTMSKAMLIVMYLKDVQNLLGEFEV